ncbi:MAG: DUF434 domain-containing protein [Bacteroidota bacterium]
MTRRNRGKQSSDDQLFAPKWWPTFTAAVDDCGYLLTRGYSENSTLQIVGNRYRLNARQRLAIQRICASDQQVEQRQQKCWAPEALRGVPVEIDGFNLLILLESALSGAYLFQGRDGTLRDIASVHGSYKRVRKTEAAILLVGQVLQAAGAGPTKWYFDQPVSNSGRLKTLLRELSEQHGFGWAIELVYNPDKALAQSDAVVVSSDGWILDQCTRWCNLGAFMVREYVEEGLVVVV